MKKVMVLCLLALALVFVTTPVKADQIITQLDVSNTNLGLTGDFATVTVDVSAAGSATFTVDPNGALLGIGSNFGIQLFGFNSNIVLLAANFALPTGWSVNIGSYNLSEFGIFYTEEVGKGNARKDPLTFTVTNTSIASASNFYVANNDGYHYAAHIAGFTNKAEVGSAEITSAWFSDGGSTQVPEPTTLLLFGLGLVGLAGVRRKLQK